jgi:hypothetical protein
MRPPIPIRVCRFRWLALLFALRLFPEVAAAAAAPASDATDRFYDPDAVQTIRLEIRSEDLERLRRALPRRIYVPSTFRWGDQTLQNVGLRYKGNSSSSPEWSHKRGFVVDFGEFEKGQRFLGLRHVALDNGIQFGSLFSERLITDILRGVGVKASRCNHARVELNGKPIGVYVNVERIDKPFLERHFESADGELFKVDEGGPGADLRLVGDDAALYHHAFELHSSGDEANAYAELLDFIRAINDPSGGEAGLRNRLDVDAFVKTTAVLLLAGAFDQYTGWGPHNYYLYHNPADKRWTYIPWDLDVGFADHAFGRLPVLDGWSAAWPAPVPGRPLMESLISQPSLLRQYREQANTILETWFRPEIIIPKLRALYDQVSKELTADPFPPRRATVPSDRGYEDILASMEDFIRKRYALARAQLDAPGDRPPPHRMPAPEDQHGPQPGPPSPDAPTDLRAVKVTLAGVELGWANHADGVVAYVVQRGAGTDATDFANAIGQPGKDVTTAVDRNVEPGKTYRYRVYGVRPTPQGPEGTGVSNVITVPIPRD